MKPGSFASQGARSSGTENGAFSQLERRDGSRQMEISARNQIQGRVKAVRTGAIMAEVEVEVKASEITAAITKSSVERLGLKAGDDVVVIIKSTEVIIGK
jgi:molybdopterin-binding protein